MKYQSLKRNRIKEGSFTVTVLLYATAVLLCFIAIYPMYYVIIKSISDPVLSLKQNVTFWPVGLYFGTYRTIVSDPDLWRAYGYTFLYTACGTVLMLFTSILGAYPLVCKNFRGRKLMVIYYLIPMYIGGGLIPSFLNNSGMGFYDNIWAMIVPGAVGIWNIVLVRTYFTSIPNELRESAEMDGAGIFRILWTIYVPLSKAVLAVIAIYTIVGKWNDWFSANIYLPRPEIQPLQLYLRRLIVAQTMDITKLKTASEFHDALQASLSAQQMKYALIVFVTLPIILVYPMFQKYFVKGVMLGSLKG